MSSNHPCSPSVRRLTTEPSSLAASLVFTDQLRSRPNGVPVAPGLRHWEIFAALCAQTGAKGNLVPDAYLAALAIEAGGEWISADRVFSRFKGLRCRHPFQ